MHPTRHSNGLQRVTNMPVGTLMSNQWVLLLSLLLLSSLLESLLSVSSLLLVSISQTLPVNVQMYKTTPSCPKLVQVIYWNLTESEMLRYFPICGLRCLRSSSIFFGISKHQLSVFRGHIENLVLCVKFLFFWQVLVEAKDWKWHLSCQLQEAVEGSGCRGWQFHLNPGD